MADLTITIGSVITATGVEVAASVSGNSITATPETAQFDIILKPAPDHSFQGALQLPSRSNVTFSPSTVNLSDGRYVFSCTDDVPPGSTESVSFNVTVLQPGKVLAVHDPTLILNPPG